jgi:chromosome segregation ATPase
MNKQKGISTVAAALITAGVVGGGAGALALYQQINLMHTRSELAEAQAQLQTANASANAARTQLNAIRKEMDEQKLDFDQARAERDSVKALLEAEKQHAERVHAELTLAREQLAAFETARSAPPAQPQLVRSRAARVQPVPGR